MYVGISILTLLCRMGIGRFDSCWEDRPMATKSPAKLAEHALEDTKNDGVSREINIYLSLSVPTNHFLHAT